MGASSLMCDLPVARCSNREGGGHRRSEGGGGGWEGGREGGVGGWWEGGREGGWVQGKWEAREGAIDLEG